MALREAGVLTEAAARTMTEMAEFRNRLVHFYDQVGGEELYQVGRRDVSDIEDVLEAILAWVRAHPELTEGEPPEAFREQVPSEVQ